MEREGAKLLERVFFFLFCLNILRMAKIGWQNVGVALIYACIMKERDRLYLLF